MPKMLILASQSPRRRELLAAAGLPFAVRLPAVPVPEVYQPGEAPLAYVRRLAEAKAGAVDRTDEEIVLGADTVVVCNGQVLEKPRDAPDAARMLRLLAGQRHEVITGICLRGAYAVVDAACSVVEFAPLSESEIAAYISSGEPLDKAGAYAIQGLASKFVTRIEGDYSNIVGLPISLVYRHWQALRPGRESVS